MPKARKLKSGKWFIQLRLGGESIPVTESTERKCEAAARLIKAGHMAGSRESRPGSPELTLRQAADMYIRSRDNVLSPATVRGYCTIRDNRFQSVMEKPVRSITDWQAVCNAEAALCSAKTLKNAWGFLSSALVYAGYKMPKAKLPQVVRKESLWLDPEQIPIFIKAIEGEPCEAQMLLALHGLRRSEIFAVTGWEKVDLDSGVIHVRGAVVPDERNRFVHKETNKNAASRRTVPIMIPRLKTLLEEKKKAGKPIVSVSPNTIRIRINKACAQNGLPEVGVHGLRHSFASLCYHLGLSERETMELGGWSDAGTMRKIYIHLASKSKAKAANKVSEFFRKTGNSFEKC